MKLWDRRIGSHCPEREDFCVTKEKRRPQSRTTGGCCWKFSLIQRGDLFPRNFIEQHRWRGYEEEMGDKQAYVEVCLHYSDHFALKNKNFFNEISTPKFGLQTKDKLSNLGHLATDDQFGLHANDAHYCTLDVPCNHRLQASGNLLHNECRIEIFCCEEPKTSADKNIIDFTMASNATAVRTVYL